MSTQHPSFGVIGAARWTAGGKGMRLFGSALPGHNAGVTLTIKEASVRNDRGHEFIYGERLVAQVYLSPVQWAELLTSMNIGDGVPCTIRYVTGDPDYRDAPPAKESMPEKAKRDFAAMLKERADRLHTRRLQVAAKLRGKVSAALAQEIDIEFQMAEQDVRTNAPWYVEQFTEATSKVVASAKAEVDAFLTNVAQQMGVKALQTGGITGLLDSKEDSDG